MSSGVRQWMLDLPMRHKLRLAILGTSAVAMLIAGSATAVLQWQAARESMQRDLNTLAEVLAVSSSAAISFMDHEAGNQILSALKARPNVTMACLYAGQKLELELLAAYSADNVSTHCSADLALGKVSAQNEMQAVAIVRLDDEVLGHLVIIESDAALRLALSVSLLTLSGVFLLSLFIALLLSGVLQRLISRPIMALAETAASIAASHDYSIRAQRFGADEVGSLIDGFNAMLSQVEMAELSLRDLNSELEEKVLERNRSNDALKTTLDQLRETQNQLVQVEKMASLGGLVAGVAHEINTPIGVGVTAASTLQMRSADIKRAFENETLTSEELTAHISMVEQSTAIILNNLERAANLIQSFKQVAVDQSSLDHRKFLVRDYIDEVLVSLGPKFKKTKIEVVRECDPDFAIVSFPGVFSQLLTNLMMNALIHAFEPDDVGQIKIQIEPTSTGFKMKFSDTGRGMSAEILPKIFDPFFTTKRGSGGSGLGLHIVYNLITQQLGGSVKVESTVGVGTTFYIEIKSIEHAKFKSTQPIA